MADYYSVAVPSTQKIYRLGTKSSVRFTLPLLIKKIVQDKNFVLYPDGGSHEDLYEDKLQYEKIYFDFIEQEDIEFADQNVMSVDEFNLFLENFLYESTRWDSFKELLKKLGR